MIQNIKDCNVKWLLTSEFSFSHREVFADVEEAVLVPVILEVEENAVEVAGFLLRKNKKIC